MPAQEKRVIKFPQKLGIKLGEIAKELGTTNETLLVNIKRLPGHRLHLKAFKIGPTEYKVYWEDLVDFIHRNYVGAQIEFN